MGKRKVYRYTIPVDDQPHVVHLTNDPLHVAVGATVDEVEFWAEHDDGALEYPAAFQVVGTGQLLPEGARYAGTCPRVRGLVWHLYRLPLTTAGTDDARACAGCGDRAGYLSSRDLCDGCESEDAKGCE